MQLVGQTLNLEIISRWEDIPNFVIIQGDLHTGKTNLVKYICSVFGYSYVLVNNSVSSVRELISVMAPNSKILYHFKDFDKASIQAKNALLKVTEETPVGNKIVITGSNQLSTLESRAIKLIMASYKEDEMVRYFGKYYNNDIAVKLFRAGVDTPAKCEYYKEYEFIEQLLYYVYETYEALSYISVDKIIVMLKKFEYKYNGIDPSYLFIEMLINVISYNIKTNLKLKYSYQNVLRLLIECKESLLHDNTLNRKLLLYRTFYQIHLLGGEL